MRGLRGQRGAVAAELTVATPLLMLLLLLIVQFALWLHAVHVADATANQALAAARVRGGTAAAGQTQAREVLTEVGGGVLEATDVTVSRGTRTVRVVVTGTAQTVVPGLDLPVRASAQGPVERFTAPTE